jgi:hypothetical protein
MRKHRRSTALTLALAGGLLAAPALYAHAAGPEEGGMMGGMMQQEGGPMMGGGMMGMMEQMNRMMATCTDMMQAHMQDHGPDGQGITPQREGAPPRPEEQPATPEERG